jgi:outer membrane protein assembly factor BamB
VADGRLYLYYYRPTGNKYYISQEEIEAGQQKYADSPTKRFFKGSYAIDADDVILCLDAATGRTLWRTVFHGKGLTCTSRKAGPNLTPCVADGKVFAMGTLGRLYCLDARTGEPLWESHIGSRFEQLVANKANLLGTGPPARSGGGCGLNAALDYAEGVLLTFDHSGGLLGADAKTGKHLWRVTSVIDTHIPVRWVHKKRAYVLVPRGSAIACVEPRTGNILWEMDGVAGNRGDALMAVDGDYLVCQVNPGPTMACFRLSLGGGKKLWTLPEGWGKGQPLPYRGHVYFWGPAGRMCVELATGAVKTDQRNPEKRKFIGTITAGDGHIFQEVDSHHNLSDTVLFVAEPQRLRQVGTRWVPPHPNGGSYVTTMIHPYVDGRLFMRGYNGIYCYDLRRR